MKSLRFVLMIGVVVSLFLPLQANADNPQWWPVPSPLLPPEVGQYVSPADWHVMYANGIYIDDVRHYAFTAHYPPPAPGSPVTESFNSTLDITAVIPGYGSIPATITNVPVSVHVAYSGQAGSITTYNTEMTQLDVAWNSPLGTVLIRESPTLPSMGVTKLDDGGGGGGYMIQSFFDIFTELSVDGGMTWVPSTNPNGDQVNFVPEPVSLALFAMGALMLVRRRQ